MKSRKINKRTLLKNEAVRLILPADADKSVFDSLSQKIEKHGGTFEITENPEKEAMINASGPVFVVGNLADSKCVEYLYHQFLSATDLWYPGPDGYEVRTLVDPFGTGFNVIHIGYSDSEGLDKALFALANKIGDEVPHISIIKPTQLHIPDKYAVHIINDVLDSKTDTFFYSIRPENKGYVAYLTGNTEALADYNQAMEYVLGKKRHHLMFYNRYTVWRLLEVTGMIDGRIAEEYPKFFYEWADSEEGVGSIDKYQYQSPYLARNNHGTITALGIKMFCGYLKTYHPEILKTEDFEKLADNVYMPYITGSWKPQCDGLCHGWWLSQPVLFHYGLADPDKKYFTRGGAQKAAECAMAVINNMGYLPTAGDSNMSRQHPGFTLRIAAAYYKDGRFKYANDILPFEYANSGEQSAMFRQFDVGIEPVRPSAGVTVTPMDELIYNTWNKVDNDYAIIVSDTAPQAGIESCFDKISFRAGWDKNDDFMLIDGLGGGGHSYSDAGAILEYSAFGIPFLVSEDKLTYVEPENHNMITICKDGLRKSIPAFPILEEIKELDGNIFYARILSKNNNGADWTREIYFISGVGVAVRDSITAVESGEFSIEAHFRTPGSVMPKEDGFISMRKNDDGDNIAFVLTGLNSEDTSISFSRQNYSHLFRTQPGKEKLEFDALDNKKLFFKRYKVNRLELTAYKAKKNIQLNNGETVGFTHFLSADKDDRRPVLVKKTDDGILVEKDDFTEILKFENRHIEKEPSYLEEEPVFDFFADLSFEGNDDFTAISKADEGYVAGCATGDLYVFDKDGEVLWSARAEGPVKAICLNDDTLYAGVGNNSVEAFRKGINIWKRSFQRIPTMFYWWEFESPGIVSIQVSDNLVLAGCGDNYLRCWDTEGNEKWNYYYRASVPYKFEISDIDKDGNNEIIISGGALSAYSQIEIIDIKGNLKFRANKSTGAGWTSFTSAVRVFERLGDSYILQGVNRKENIILRKFTGVEKENHFETVFSYKLAGVVSALLEHDGILYAGTSLGFLSAYDMQGEKKWGISLNGGIRYIAKTKSGLLVAEFDGTMYRLTDSGIIETLSMDSLTARAIIEDDEKLIMIQQRGIYHIMKEAENEEF